MLPIILFLTAAFMLVFVSDYKTNKNDETFCDFFNAEYRNGYSTEV